MLELPEVELWVAESLNNDIIAANLMVFYGDTATYLHGASNYAFRALMAPNLLQWNLIQEAKKRGFKYYDFHGIAPNENPKHPWAGVTRFKKGFGGEIANYPGTYDFIYETGWYKIYKLFRKINRLIKI
jgi:lipid II:glycine glycyltransferase (peptidoglycan interpeptide bridge formation enzyme)